MIDLKQTVDTNLGLILTPRIDLSLKILSMNVIEIEEQLKEIAESNPLVKIEDDTLIKKQPLLQDKTREIEEAFKEKFSKDEDSVSDIIEATVQSLDNIETALLKQLRYEIDLDETDEEIAKHIIFNLDEKGFLGIEREKIAKELSVAIDRVERIRRKIMLLEPLGCGSLNSKEFLLLQAEEENKSIVPFIKKIIDAIEETNRFDLNKIKQFSNLDEATFRKMIEKIRDFMLYPLENYHNLENQVYVQPDVYIKRIGNGFVAILEDKYLNNVSIDEQMLEKYLKDESAKEYIKEKYRQVKELILAITNRNKTLLKTVNIILDKQRQFFENGTLMPLTRKEIAEILDFNVSTITRAVSNKYLEFEGKIIPLNKLFTSGITENISKEFVKSLIRDLISNENKTNPLSDDQIREKLKSRGIELTRRTVTKYRKELKIPSSRERKWQGSNQR